MNAGDLVAQMGMNTRDFSKGTNQVKNDLGSIRSSLGMLKGAFAGFLSVQALRGAFGAFKETIGKLDDLAAQSDRLGVASDFLSELHYAAKLSDTDVEALNGGLEKMQKVIGSATLKGGDLDKMLARVGTNAEELKAMGPEKAFMLIADTVSKIADPMQRAAFVTEIFGKSGQSLIGILSKGSKGIEELRQEARAMGASFGGDMIKKAGEADDAFKRIDASAEGLKATIAIALAPVFTDTLAPAITSAANQIREFDAACGATDGVDGMATSIGVLAQAMAILSSSVQVVSKAFMGLQFPGAWISNFAAQFNAGLRDTLEGLGVPAGAAAAKAWAEATQDALDALDAKILAGGAVDFGGKALDEIRKNRLRNNLEKIGGNGKGGGKGGPGGGGAGDAIDLGDATPQNVKSFAKNSEVFSKEGFSIIAQAMAGKSTNINAQQLAEMKKANGHLGKIAGDIKNIAVPGVGAKL